MSQFTIKTKDTKTPSKRDAMIMFFSTFMIVMIAILIQLFILGSEAGTSCDPTNNSCGYGSYCINEVCRPSCDEEQDCPEGIKCVTSERRRLFTREPIKVCQFPNELEQSINRSLDEMQRKLDERLRMIRKKTDVFNWLIIRLMHERSQISNKQFKRYWSEIDLEERRQLTIERLGQMIIHRHTSP